MLRRVKVSQVRPIEVILDNQSIEFEGITNSSEEKKELVNAWSTKKSIAFNKNIFDLVINLIYFNFI